jgi:hypothetical protein
MPGEFRGRFEPVRVSGSARRRNARRNRQQSPIRPALAPALKEIVRDRTRVELHGYFAAYQLQGCAPASLSHRPGAAFPSNDRNNAEQLTPEIKIIRVGLAESRRHGLRVVMRQSMNKKI